MIIFKFLKKIRIIIAGLAVIFLIILIFSQGSSYHQKNMSFGVTFSSKKARDLNLDWKKVYTSIFQDLNINKIRIPAYWDEIEPKNNKYNWQKLDWQIKTANKHDAKIILAVGKRLPRWPECHFPDWIKNTDIRNQWKSELLQYIEKTINRYKNNNNIKAWQVENEPFLSSHFGECPSLDTDFLDKEISLVKKLDSRPIIITDSGELSLWAQAASRADIFGITMYKNTYSKTLGRYISYPIGPDFFHFKKNIANFFANPEKWIVIELQAEPWGPIPYQNLTKKEKNKTMSLQKLDDMTKFAGESGFQEVYLWGVEWWYWEKEKNNNPQYWEKIKQITNKK